MNTERNKKKGKRKILVHKLIDGVGGTYCGSTLSTAYSNWTLVNCKKCLKFKQ